MSQQRIETICVQGGYTPGNGEPGRFPSFSPPHSSTPPAKIWASCLIWRLPGIFIPACKTPPTNHVAAKIAALEGGTAAMLTSSGQAANFFALFNIATCGDHIVASSSIYGGTFNLISVTMAKMGITCTFVAPDCTAEELDAAFRPNTRAVFGETIANPRADRAGY